MLCKYTKHCLLVQFNYNRHHLYMLPVMCVRGCVQLFGRLRCPASQNSGYFTYLWSCIIVFLSQSHRRRRCVFLFCISLGKSHSRTVISVICVMFVVCPPIFLSDLKPLSQHRKHSDAVKAYQKIYCGHTHFTV